MFLQDLIHRDSTDEVVELRRKHRFIFDSLRTFSIRWWRFISISSADLFIRSGMSLLMTMCDARTLDWHTTLSFSITSKESRSPNWWRRLGANLTKWDNYLFWHVRAHLLIVNNLIHIGSYSAQHHKLHPFLQSGLLHYRFAGIFWLIKITSAKLACLYCDIATNIKETDTSAGVLHRISLCKPFIRSIQLYKTLTRYPSNCLKWTLLMLVWVCTLHYNRPQFSG